MLSNIIPTVYIVTNKRNGTLYIGVTSDLINRITDHKNNKYPNSFTAKYKLNILVYYETHDTMESAINREKQIKKWNRQWKINLIIKDNPEWKDLYETLFY